MGTVVEVGERTAFAGAPYPVVVVRTEDGRDLAFHGFHTVAKEELARLTPKPGETIGIAYHGRPAGKDYELYRVKVMREEVEPDWEGIRREAEVERAELEAQVAEHGSPSPLEDLPF